MKEIKSVENILEERRIKSEEEFKSRIESIYEKWPKLREIEDNKTSLWFKLIKETALKNKEETNAIKLEIQALEDEKKELLKNFGIDTKSLKRKYFCDKCKDTGMISGVGICSCKKQLIISKNFEISGLKNILKKENFDTFNLSVFDDKELVFKSYTTRDLMKIYLRDAKDYVENFSKETFNNIMYFGGVGTGKSFLCNCIAKGILDKGFTVLYLPVAKLFKICSDYLFKNSEYHDNLMTMIENIDLLIIDDLGTESKNINYLSYLFTILYERNNNEKSTIISTNLGLKEINEYYGNRIYSRIIGDFKLVNILGKDLRVS